MPNAPTTPSGVPGYTAPAWQVWWNYNRDPYLGLRSRIAGLEAVSGESGAGLSPQRGQVQRDVVPGLLSALRMGGDADVTSTCLIALARIEDDIDEVPQGMNLDWIARDYVKRDHPPSVEASLVALGVRGAESSVELLEHLVLNTPEGQKIRGDYVEPRTRTFAAYALGLYARKVEDPALRQRIGESLARVLIEDETATYELHMASMISMGLAPAKECEAGEHEAGHVCLGYQIGMMLQYFEDGERESGLRAHAGPVLARLVTAAKHPQYKETIGRSLLDVLGPRSDEDDEIKEGAVIGLGHIGDSDNDDIDKDIRKTLERIISRDEGLQRRLALMSLARVAARPGEGKAGKGAENSSDFLVRQLAHGKDGLDSWAAVALGVYEFHRMREMHDLPSEDVLKKLETSVAKARSANTASAACIGLGVLRSPDAADQVLARFERAEDEGLRGYAALSLGMLGAQDAVPALREMLEDSDSPSEIYGAALGLRLLGDREVAATVLERLREVGQEDEEDCDDDEEADEEEDTFAAKQAKELELDAEREVLAAALGVLADRRTIPPLLEILLDEEQEGSLRAAAAAALGVMCDEESESWAAPICNDLNYGTLGWTMVDPFGDGTGILDLR